MTYSEEITCNHSVIKRFDNCLEDINQLIINEGKDYYGIIPHFANNEVVINLDEAEIQVANSENRILNPSMDMAFGIVNDDNSIKAMLMVELKLNVINPNRLNEVNLIGKAQGSQKILGNEITIYDKWLIVVKGDLIDETRSKLDRMYGRILHNFIPTGIDQLKSDYFQ
jgi:hypothetical protein